MSDSVQVYGVPPVLWRREAGALISTFRGASGYSTHGKSPVEVCSRRLIEPVDLL